jgi:hypothetical protein
MSKSTETTTPITVVPDEQAEVVKKENPLKRGINYVKNHKKAALAVAGLVVLVGASAALGGSSSNDSTTFAEELPDDAPVLEIKDENGNVTDLI